jgi:ElaB/YqjD/DUF883 family membrane-anchored ribosome-binding protein
MRDREFEDNRRPEEIEGDIERTRAEVSSTIDAIQSKLTPGQLMDQAVSYMRTSAPADFGANLSNTVRDNPIPVALIGVGIAWLMMSGQRTDGMRRRSRTAYDVDGDVYQRDLYAADDAGAYGVDYASELGAEKGRMRRVAASVGEAGHNVKDSLSESGHNLMDKVSETARTVRDKAGELAHRVGDTASGITGRSRHLGDEARGRMHGSLDDARGRIGELGQRSQHQYHRARDGISHVIEEQPLVLGALGVAIGAALGAALPRTQREDEWMGGTRDELVESAKETAREQMDTVKESAQRVARAAEQEVERVAGDASRSGAAHGNGHANRPGASGGTDPTRPGTDAGVGKPGGTSGQQGPR